MYNIMKLKIHIRYKMTLRVDFTCRVVNGSRSQVISMVVNALGLFKIALIGLTFLFFIINSWQIFSLLWCKGKRLTFSRKLL